MDAEDHNAVKARRNLTIHIGHYKTGTTALQVFLARNRDLLMRQGLVYAAAPLDNAKHSALALGVLRDAGVTTQLYGFKHPDTAKSLWAQLFASVRALPDDQTMLISSEEFIRFGAHPGAVDLLQQIIATAPDIRIRIIAYLRSPQAHLRSWHNQLAKMRIPVAAFDAAVTRAFEPVHYDYSAAMAPWIALFGPEAVTIRQFDDRLRNDAELFHDFLELFGCRLPLTAELPDGDPNPRLDPRLVDFKRALTRAGIGQPMARQLLERAVETLRFDDATPSDAPTTPDFSTIRTVAEKGLRELAALPDARLDLDAMLADLPRPLDPDERSASAAFMVLATELARMRAAQAVLNRRITAIEHALAIKRDTTK